MKNFVIETKKADITTYLDGVLESTYTLVTEIITPSTSYLRAVTGIEYIEIDPENTAHLHYVDGTIEPVKNSEIDINEFVNFLNIVSYLQTKINKV